MKTIQELSIIEITGSIAGSYAGKFFADAGSKVVKFEPIGGDPLNTNVDTETLYRYLNSGKRFQELNLMNIDQDSLANLLEDVDLVIESSAPDPLLPVSKSLIDPKFVSLYISPFGLQGSYSKYRSNSFTDQAISGHMLLNGLPDKHPIAWPGYQSYYQAGIYGFIGAMAALIVRDRNGIAQSVDVSHYSGMVSLHQNVLSMWEEQKYFATREGNRQSGFAHPMGFYECKDGHVCIASPDNESLNMLLNLLGVIDFFIDEPFNSEISRANHKNAFDEKFQLELINFTADKIVKKGQSVFLPIGKVNSFEDVIGDSHLASQGFWNKNDLNSNVLSPSNPLKINGVNLPFLNSNFRTKKIEPFQRHILPESDKRVATNMLPLSGIRIIDLTKVWAGPLATRILSDLGAEVIKIESLSDRGYRELPDEYFQRSQVYPTKYFDKHHWNKNGVFNALNRNKKSLALDLNSVKGRAILRELIKKSDILVDNFSPRVMDNWGLDANELLLINPNLIHASITGYGAKGPKRNVKAFGTLIEAESGFASLMKYQNGGPFRSGVPWADPLAGLVTVAGIMMAINDKQANFNNKDIRVEVSMLETMISSIGELYVQLQEHPDEFVTDHSGNVPQKSYRCKGTDSWIALSIDSQESWTNFCKYADFEPQIHNFSFEQRRDMVDDLNTIIEKWSIQQDAKLLMHSLQKIGIICTNVSNAQDIYQDAHLASNNYWESIYQPEVGVRNHAKLPLSFDKMEPSVMHPAPSLGEHNSEILQGILGFNEDIIASLESSPIIGNDPNY
jgi:crotonobetainyl-CoA:carnitine CoA-transferase CaiB-like acyl-CoA transferase